MSKILEDLIQKRKQMYINSSKEKELYTYFFNAMRKWLDKSNTFNYVDDICVYFSLDDGKFVKLPKNDKGKPIINFIKIPFNSHKFFYFKQNLGDNPIENITPKGRKINNVITRDEVFNDYIAFIDDIFYKFYNENCTSPLDIKSKSLF